MANNSSRTGPVRLPNPTAESFIQALKVVRFFAVILFWIVLVVVLAQLAAFILTEWAGLLGTAEASAREPPAELSEGESTPDVPEEAAGEEADTLPPPPVREPEAQSSGWFEGASGALAPMRIAGIIACVLLWVTLFLFLQISLLGRLGGIKQLTLSVFLMLLFLASALPWSALLDGVGTGSLFPFAELARARVDRLGGSAYVVALFYLRYLGLSVLSLLLLLSAWVNFSRGYEEAVLLNE